MLGLTQGGRNAAVVTWTWTRTLGDDNVSADD